MWNARRWRWNPYTGDTPSWGPAAPVAFRSEIPTVMPAAVAPNRPSTSRRSIADTLRIGQGSRRQSPPARADRSRGEARWLHLRAQPVSTQPEKPRAEFQPGHDVVEEPRPRVA